MSNKQHLLPQQSKIVFSLRKFCISAQYFARPWI